LGKKRRISLSPKTAAVSVACLALALAALAAAAFFVPKANREGDFIGEEMARNFAYADLGVDPLSAENVKTVFGFEQGQFVYKVYFTSKGTEHEYWVKAYDGTVVKKGMDLVAGGQGEAEGQEGYGADVPAREIRSTEEGTLEDVREGSGDSGKAPYDIGLDEAKSIAASHAGFSVPDVVFSKVKLEEEDGQMVYEIEFYQNGMEYEYEIVAASGEILKFESEPEDD
jgi:uncharacterized membrane protein YkoI